MANLFLEVILPLFGRDGADESDCLGELEDTLEEELSKTGAGHVTGSGSGYDLHNLDVSLAPGVDLAFGVATLRSLLAREGVPRGARIRSADPEASWSVYESS